MNRLVSKLAFAAALACGSIAVSAAPLVFGTLLAGPGPANPTFAELSVTPSGPDLDLTLTVIADPAFDAFGTGFAVTSLVIVAITGTDPGTCCSNPDVVPVAGPPGVAHFDFTTPLVGPSSISWTWSGPVISSIDLALQVKGFSLTGSPVELFYGPAVAAPPVPEPESYALMLGGLGVLAFLARRRA
jgi:hypothetical protein